MRGVLDVGRTGRAGHGPADRLVDDLIGLVGVLDGGAVLHRRREEWFLTDELDAPAPDPALGDAGPLAAHENHRRVLHLRALNRPRDVRHAWTERANAQTRPARHSRRRLGHETRTEFVMRCDHRPPTSVGLGEHVHEVRVWDTEQSIHTFSLEQVEDAFVDGHAP